MPESNVDLRKGGKGSDVGEMHARRESMADGKRYIIYYTFGDPNSEEGEAEVKAEDV